ncbi:SGNH/GDSL hydrolase family protein [Streptomyces sp. NPDC018610]|uniref:SGNH/GDSL hydrolase family protein n=1 Tax=Streptomyces sp. NPDC018610 TaxID=3365049 RepID=UPI0037B89879
MQALSTAAACAALACGLIHAAPASAAPATASSGHRQTGGEAAPPRIADPDKTLGRGWKTSGDRAVTLAADTDGVHLLVADSRSTYTWKTAAVLSEPGMQADTWIGNECVMDHAHAAVAYAPRTFTNRQDLMERGAFTAIVDLDSGHVTKLPFTASLAYFSPACNPALHKASFTVLRDDKTRLVTVDTAGKQVDAAVVAGQVTSAVPVRDGSVAARGDHLVHIGRKGAVKNLASTDGVPYEIHVADKGRIAFLDHEKSTSRARVLDSGHVNTVATGKLGGIGLGQGTGPKVFLTGEPTGETHLPAGLTRLDAPADTTVSSAGRLAVSTVLTPGVRAGLQRIADAGRHFTKNTNGPTTATVPGQDAASQDTTVTATATATGEKVTQSVQGTGASNGSGKAASPALGTAAGTEAGKSAGAHSMDVTAADTSGISHDTVDTDRYCSVPRNDTATQALQPTPNQVEWAVDMAVRDDLSSGWITQGGWRSQTGLGTIDPQSLFPLPQLTGGGRIPAQVLLGVMAQESNLWQAENGAVPGQMGNPLASTNGFYGHVADPDNPMAYWEIHWDKSDCGYGVGQVTDGMRIAGHAKDGETLLDPNVQRAVALDYTVNVAASARILALKWNEIHSGGQTITVNNDSASAPENWFAALWDYNSGLNTLADASQHDGHWGLGWYNNPANPIYSPNRLPFMDTDRDANANHDAAHPQDWPYQEKVLGWAAWSIDTGYSYDTDGKQDREGDAGYSTAGFRPAWWTDAIYRSAVKPTLDTFCNTDNACDVTDPPPCETQHIDGCDELHWWNAQNATWKPDCATTCGHESLKYDTLRSEPGRGYNLDYGNSVCTTDGLPSGSVVVSSVPNGTPTWSDCGSVKGDSGSFQFTFLADSDNHFEARGDLHQIGGGYGGHFWYAHTRSIDTGVRDIDQSATWYDSATGEFVADGNAAKQFLSTPVETGGLMAVTGDWKVGQHLDGWQRVWVHVPDTGMTAHQAIYTIHTGSGTTNRTINAHLRANTWVSLGAVHFSGSDWQGVTLTNFAFGATADNTIAWDSVAFTALPGKPKQTVVQLGDSYASGTGVGDYYTNSDTGPHLDHDATKPATFDACLRSKRSWIRQTVLPGTSSSIGAREDASDTSMDFHSVACSGATTEDAARSGQYGEIPQLYSGFVDDDTTLVAMTIGGDDAHFSKILTDCTVTGCPSDDTVQGYLSTAAANDKAFLAEVHTEAPNAQIVLLGYPMLYNTDYACTSLFSADQRTSLHDWGAALNADEQDAVATSADATGGKAVFYDPAPQFDGHLLCDDDEALHGFTKTPSSDIASDPWWAVTSPASMESFHPNAEGAQLYATALEQVLTNIGYY